jgi:tRNA (cmo5U34)-methyltransferase
VFWDLVRHEAAAVEGQQAARWSAYLEGMGGPALRDKVFAYVEEEDSPESASFILLALAEAGFEGIDIVHKNGPFVAMTAHRPRAGEA